MFASLLHGTRLLHDDDVVESVSLFSFFFFPLRWEHFKQDGGCTKPNRA